MGTKFREVYMGEKRFAEYERYKNQSFDTIFPESNGWERAYIGKNVLAGIFRNSAGKIVNTVFIEIDPEPTTAVLDSTGYAMQYRKIEDLPFDIWKGSYEVLVKTDRVAMIQSTMSYGKKRLYAYVKVEK